MNQSQKMGKTCISNNLPAFKNWGKQECDTFWLHLLLSLYKNSGQQTDLIFVSKTFCTEQTY